MPIPTPEVSSKSLAIVVLQYVLLGRSETQLVYIFTCQNRVYPYKRNQQNIYAFKYQISGFLDVFYKGIFQVD